MNMPQSIRNNNTKWKNINTAFFGLFFIGFFLKKAFFGLIFLKMCDNIN